MSSKRDRGEAFLDLRSDESGDEEDEDDPADAVIVITMRRDKICGVLEVSVTTRRTVMYKVDGFDLAQVRAKVVHFLHLKHGMIPDTYNLDWQLADWAWRLYCK